MRENRDQSKKDQRESDRAEVRREVKELRKQYLSGTLDPKDYAEKLIEIQKKL